MQQMNRNNPPRTMLNDKRLKLSGKNNQGKFCSFAIHFSGKKGRITVYTNEDGDADKGRMAADLELLDFEALMETMEHVIKNPIPAGQEEVKDFILIRRPNWDRNGGRPNGNVDVGRFYIGKNKEGIVWLSLAMKDRPNIRFHITGSEMHEWYHGTGERYSAGEVSAMYARSYISKLRKLVDHYSIEQWVEDPPKQGRGGQGGGGGGYQQNNQGGGYQQGGYQQQSNIQQSPPEFTGEDDMPF